MSIIDLIKEQQLLTLTIGMALMPLGLAVLLVMFLGLRRGLKVLSERRAAAKARKLAAIEEANRLREERKVAAQEAKKQRRLEKAAAIKAQKEEAEAEAIGEAIEETVEPTLAEAVAEGDSDEDEEEDEESEGESSGAMQELLDSVFGTEEQDQRYKTLLEGIEEINIDELASLAQSVAEQLHKAS